MAGVSPSKMLAAELHHSVTALAPEAVDVDEHLAVPSHYIIAVLRHDQDSPQWNAHPKDRLLWIKGRAKVTVKKVLKTYNAQSHIGDDIRIELRIGSR